MTTARFMLASACALGLIAFPATLQAQDRIVSVPDIYAESEADALVAHEVTSAIRLAANMAPGWRVSSISVPLVELMRACNAITEVPAPSCLEEMSVRRDPDVASGLLLMGILPRSQLPGPTLNLRLALYDNVTDEVVASLELTVDRITSPAARNRDAADWIRRLMEPPVVMVSETPSIAPSVDAPPAAETDPETASTENPDPVVEPAPPAGRTVLDTTATDVVGWVLVGTALASAVSAGITGGLLLNLNEDTRFRGYRASWDESRVADVCDMAANDPSADGLYAQSVCDQAATLEILTHVMWAASGTLAFAGMIFIIWHPGAPSREVAPTTVRLAPILGPTRAGLDLTIEF